MAEPLNSPPGGETDDRAAARVGEIIRGKWHLDALLGVGGMAAVYASSHRNGQRAALKILHADFARDRVVCDRFLREAYVSNKIGHPACVRVLDDDMTEDSAPFLVMELLEGETVRDAWKKCGRVMAVPKVLRICDVVLDCLASCHALGVIHRDLKPANVFLTGSGDVKVLDFGVAQMRSATTRRTAAGTALGTPAYMSPEQAMGLVDQLDGRADVFSVGAMIHALVTGQRINNGRTEQEALVMAATMPAASVARLAPDLPLPVIALVDKALAWDRRNRFDDARQMQAAVRQAMACWDGLEADTAPDQGEPTRTAAPKEEAGAPTARRPGVGAAAPGSNAEPARIHEAPAVPESDPRVETARELFRHIDRIFPSARQFGWEHPATERAMRTAFEAWAEALGKEASVELAVRPYSLLALGHSAWEPAPPFDAVPYNLFAAGVRTLTVARGLTLDELRALLALLLIDPGRDLPPEDDLVSAFWEKALEHVALEVVDTLAEGDASEREAFFGQADEVEAMAAEAAQRANAIEAKAMALSTDRAALDRARPRAPSPMGLDDVVRAVLAQRLEVSREKWSERYVDALVEGYLDAAGHRDAPLVLASLRKSAADLVVAGRLTVGVAMHDALVARLAQRVKGEDLARLSAALTNALFGAETLELALGRLQKEPGEVAVFEPILRALWAAELPTALIALSTTPPGSLRDALAHAVRRAGPPRARDGGGAVAGGDGSEPRRRTRRAPRPIVFAGVEAGPGAARLQRRRDPPHRGQGAPRVVRRASARGADAAPRERVGPRADGRAARRHAPRAQAGLARHRAAGSRAELPRARGRRAAGAHAHARRALARPRRTDGRRAREEGGRLHLRGPRDFARARRRGARRVLPVERDGGRPPRSRADALGDERRDTGGGGRGGEAHRRAHGGRGRAPVTMRLDIVTNDAGDLVRREHARELGAGVVVALYRLARQAQMHDLGNQAFVRQLEQTHQAIGEYCLRSGMNVNVLFAKRAVFIAGQLLKGSRGTYEAAAELAELMEWCGGSELSIAKDVTQGELLALAEAISAASRAEKGRGFRSPSPKIRLRAVGDAARMRGLQVERLPLDQRIARNYASAVVVLRRFFDDLVASRYVLPRRIKRIAQTLVDLSAGNAPAFLGVTEARNANHDAAGRAINSAILALLTAREVTSDRGTLAQIAMASMMHDVGRPRAVALATAGGPKLSQLTARLAEDAEDRLPAGTAAVLTALGRVNEPSITRTVIAFEALSLRRAPTVGPVYRGARSPTLHARIVTIARRYTDLVTPEPGLEPLPPETAIALLASERVDAADRNVLRMLVAALGLFPVGTVVQLSSGEVGEVIERATLAGRPRVRLAMDAQGGVLATPSEVDLAAVGESRRITRVMGTDAWKKGAEGVRVDRGAQVQAPEPPSRSAVVPTEPRAPATQPAVPWSLAAAPAPPPLRPRPAARLRR